MTQKVVEVTNHQGELASLTTDLAMLKIQAEEELGKLSAELQAMNKEVEAADATKEKALGEIATHEANIQAEEVKEKDLKQKVRRNSAFGVISRLLCGPPLRECKAAIMLPQRRLPLDPARPRSTPLDLAQPRSTPRRTAVCPATRFTTSSSAGSSTRASVASTSSAFASFGPV